MPTLSLEITLFTIFTAVGRYLGLESITHDGVTAEYVKISYDENALLYIPTDKLDLLSKYIGARAEDGSVRLSRTRRKGLGKGKKPRKKSDKGNGA